MDGIIQEIRDNVTRKNDLSASGLSLTLLDKCGKIAFPDMKHKKGRPDSRERYAEWYNKYIYAYEKHMVPLV